MNISILEFPAGAKQAKGVVVIIDVFRAFSVACYAFDAGASRVIAVKSPEDAFALRKKYRRSVLAGESNERKIDGFDIGNSPTEILKCALDGYTLIHCTTAGTKGLVSASGAEVLLAGSLVNASATARYISRINPRQVTLVAMGYRATVRAEEDILCARIIEGRLRGGNNDFSDETALLKDGAGKRFFDPANIEFSPPTDFFLCTMTDRFSFAITGHRRDDGNVELVAV